MTYQLGIDLGTTYTAAAVCRSSDRGRVEPEVVTLGTRGATVPSVLFIADDGSVVVGEAAERRAVTDPDRVVREFKRRIGDPTPIVVAGRAWAPEELSARLVRWVVDRVAEREGGPADKIAVTHPASWGPHKMELLAGALARQGLTVMFLAEPQAAALHYATSERVGPGSTIAVYDLGGGTFDAAVVHKSDSAGPAGFGLLGRPEGLERLGGVDFDQVVFDHVRDGLPDAFQSLDDSDPEVLAAVSRLRRDCTEAKEALSSDTEASIPVMLPATRGSVRLHRSEFEALIRPQVEETVTALRRAVGSAGLQPAQLTAVLLVGGSSRIPLVGELVSEQLGRPVAVDADPKNAIAKGAALAVSPRPAMSWPANPVPPVAGAAAAGAAGAGAVAGVAAPAGPPPARPPRTGLPQQPPSAPRHGSAPAAMAAPPPRPQTPRISHESANSLYSAGDGPPRPSPRPARQAEPDWEYDNEPPRGSKRPVGLLIGVGGVLAIAALVAGIMVWGSRSDNAANVTPSDSGTTSEPAAPTSEPKKEEPVAPVPTKEPTKPPATKPAQPTTKPRQTTNPTTSAAPENPPPAQSPTTSAAANPPPVQDTGKPSQDDSTTKPVEQVPAQPPAGAPAGAPPVTGSGPSAAAGPTTAAPTALANGPSTGAAVPAALAAGAPTPATSASRPASVPTASAPGATSSAPTSPAASPTASAESVRAV